MMKDMQTPSNVYLRTGGNMICLEISHQIISMLEVVAYLKKLKLN